MGLNDKVIFAPDLLDEALKTAGNQARSTLNVLDVKTGKKTPVKINATIRSPGICPIPWRRQ